MDARERQYRKAAKQKAKEYKRKKRGYKSREEKKAFRIAENYVISEWKKSLSYMDTEERQAQKRAYRRFRLRVLFPMLPLAALGLILLAVLLVIFL